MEPNVVSFDRFVRLALGGIPVVLAAIGLILLVTGVTRTCLIYATLGLSTADRSTEDEATAGKPA